MKYAVYRSLAGRRGVKLWKVVDANTPEAAAKVAGIPPGSFTNVERTPTRYNYTWGGWSYTLRRAVNAEIALAAQMEGVESMGPFETQVEKNFDEASDIKFKWVGKLDGVTTGGTVFASSKSEARKQVMAEKSGVDIVSLEIDRR